MELADKRCKPCEGGVQPLTREQCVEVLKVLHPAWLLSDDGLSISRTFKFPAYDRTLGFANAVAWIAIEYGQCHVSFTTHAINGLSDNDFICAAKVDRVADAAAP